MSTFLFFLTVTRFLPVKIVVYFQMKLVVKIIDSKINQFLKDAYCTLKIMYIFLAY